MYKLFVNKPLIHYNVQNPRKNLFIDVAEAMQICVQAFLTAAVLNLLADGLSLTGLTSVE